MALENVIDRVSQQGDAHRKTVGSDNPWMPPADSGLWEVYRRYCRDTERPVGAKVGRCHFWHVVLVFSPLRKFGQWLSKSTGLSGLVLLGALVVLGAIESLVGWLSGNWLIAPVIAAGVLGVVGVLGGIGLYIFLQGEDDNSMQDIIDEILDKKDKWSIGAILVMLAGPAILTGLTVAFLFHQFCRLIRNLPGVDWVADHGGAVFGAVVATVVISLASVYAYVYGIHPFGWWQSLLYGLIGLVGVAVVIAGLAGLLFTGSVVRENVVKYRAAHPVTVTAGDPPPEGLFKRIWRSIVSAARFAWHVVRLIAEVVRYGYKSICHLVPVPPDPEAEHVEAVVSGGNRCES